MSRANPEAGAAGHAFFASFLGWTLDAFDFFVLVFVLPAVADEFHRSVADVAYTITLTLAMRPIGALVFGWMADRYGRRIPLMIDVAFYSIVEILSGLAPDYSTFLALRVLYGIGMGGEWGVGASLAMEVVPAARRGLLSGLLQEGYAIGYLLAAAAYFAVFPALGWRALFLLGGVPALLVLYIRSHVPESPAWQRSRPEPRRIVRAVAENFGSLLYLTLFMAMLSLMSHGTQDMYPTFLEKERGLSPRMVATIAIIYNFGALAGGLAFGALSDRFGRRRAMVLAALGAALVIPRVDLLALVGVARGGRVRDAVHGAGRLGRRPRASHGALSRRGARLVPRSRLSARRTRGRGRAVLPSPSGDRDRLREHARHRRRRRDGPRRGGHRGRPRARGGGLRAGGAIAGNFGGDSRWPTSAFDPRAGTRWRFSP